MNNFEQLLIEIGLFYISTLKSPQHQSLDRNLGFSKGRIFFCYLIQLRVLANEVISREIQLRYQRFQAREREWFQVRDLSNLYITVNKAIHRKYS